MEIFRGKFPVAYGQFYILLSNDFDGDMESCFAEQNNGICGTANSDVVFFITGLHTGNIHLELEVLDSAPPLDDEFEEIVEASFRISQDFSILVDWNNNLSFPLNLKDGEYRARYSAKNMGLAEDSGDFEAGNIELYQVEIWPSAHHEDKILKVTSERAKYWHEEVAGTNA